MVLLMRICLDEAVKCTYTLLIMRKMPSKFRCTDELQSWKMSLKHRQVLGVLGTDTITY